MAQNMNQANIQYLPQWRAAGNSGDLPVGWTPGSGASSTQTSGVTDPVETAQKLLAFQQQANQPAVQQLQSSIDPLTQRYNDLINSIKGQATAAQSQGTVAENYAQQGASMDLGRRGLLPQSQEGQQALSTALLPVQAQNQATQAQFGGLLSQTGVAEQSDINSINSAIAQLQAGQTAQSVTGAQNIYGAQAGLAGAQAYPNAVIQSAQLQNQYREIPYMGGLYSTTTGSLINQLNGGQGGAGGIQVINGIPYINA